MDASWRWQAFSALVLSSSLAIAAVLVVREGWPSFSVLVPFGVLVVYCELKAVYARDTAISPGWMIGMAAIVAFHAENSLLGPLLIGMLAGLDLVDLRGRRWNMLCVNVGMLSLATFAG